MNSRDEHYAKVEMAQRMNALPDVGLIAANPTGVGPSSTLIVDESPRNDH